MNRMFIDVKGLSKVAIASSALLILTIFAISFMSSPRLSAPVYLIFSSESNLDEKNRKEVRKWLGLHSYISDVELVREDTTQIIIDTPDLLAQLEHNNELKDGVVSYYLFKIDNPIRKNKKILRKEIETKFHGLERKNNLRKIIAVIELEVPETNDTHEPNYRQFEDNLIYFQDNFGGVGLLINNVEINVISNYGEIIRRIFNSDEN